MARAGKRKKPVAPKEEPVKRQAKKPKGKGKRPAARALPSDDEEQSEDDEERDEPTAARTVGQGSIAAYEKMSADEQKSRVAAMVRCALFRGANQKVIAWKDFRDLMPDEHKKADRAAFEEAIKQLAEVFGYTVVELPKPQKEGEAPVMFLQDSAAVQSNVYIVTNTLPAARSGDQIDWGLQSPTIALILTILSFVYSNKGEIAEDELLKHLSRLGIKAKRSDNSHPTFGDVSKLLASFVDQKYLQKMKRPNHEPPVYDFRWGQRARVEFSETSILKFIADVYDEDVDAWLDKLGKSN